MPIASARAPASCTAQAASDSNVPRMTMRSMPKRTE